MVEGELDSSKNQPVIIDDEILFPIDTVRKYFDPNIYWDEELKKVTITTENKVIRLKTDSLEALINNKPVAMKIPVRIEKEITYIPIEFLSELYGIEVNFLKEKNIIIVDFNNRVKQTAEPAGDKAVVRKLPSIRAPILKKFGQPDISAESQSLLVFEMHDKWYKVRTSEGIIGYMEKKHVVIKGMTIAKFPEPEPADEPWKPEDGKINLVWEMMYTKRPDLSKIENMEGLDILSPTWFQLANSQGTLINRADAKYVEWAHENGYKVWALLANDFNDPAMTRKFLNNTDSRDALIRQLLTYASLYKLDGINIDFENIYKEDKNALTQFVRELTPFLKEQGLVVSMDVTVPDGSDNWSLCYDRPALGGIVDYIMLMTYDQHWSSSPKSGSVAQISWVEKNLEKTLELVPANKLLLGLPFYTRLWKEEPGENGKVKVTSQALTMDQARKAVIDNGGSINWDEESGQFYGEYKKDNIIYKVWLEDKNSINLKSSLVQKYDLAGAASWSRTFEQPEIWTVLNTNLKSLKSYQAWADENKDRKYVFN